MWAGTRWFWKKCEKILSSRSSQGGIMPSLRIAMGLSALGISEKHLDVFISLACLFKWMNHSTTKRGVRLAPQWKWLKSISKIIQFSRCFSCFFVAQLGSRADRISQRRLLNLPMFGVQILKWYDLMIQWMRFLISLLCSTGHLPKLARSERGLTCLLVGTKTLEWISWTCSESSLLHKV